MLRAHVRDKIIIRPIVVTVFSACHRLRLQDFQKNVGTRLSVYSHASETDKLRDLEEEQEQLNSSLLALTSHFAQVQFRLKQIVDSDGAEKEVSGCTFIQVRSLPTRPCP